MKAWQSAVAMVSLALMVTVAHAQSNVRVRGTITAIVFTVAQTAPDGTLRTARIQISKDGVNPPQ